MQSRQVNGDGPGPEETDVFEDPPDGKERRLKRLRRLALLAGVFVVVLTAHAWSPVPQSPDSRFSIHVAMSIIAEGNTNLDEYGKVLADEKYYNIEEFGGHKYVCYPVGPSLLALPFVAAADVWDRLVHGHSFQHRIEKRIPQRFEKFVASVIIAFASVLIFLIADRRLNSVARSLLIVFVFAFCTSAWSTASRGLWQHGPTMLVFSATLYLLLLAVERPKIIPFTGLLLAFSYVIRPTNILPASVLAIFILLRYRRQFLPLLAWAALVLIPFFAYNYSLCGKLLHPYYMPGSHSGSGTFFEALAGHLISPGRGLFVFSPVLILFFLGVYFKLREKRMEMLDLFMLAAIVLYMVMISFAARWWAGHCFGPRYVADMIPFFVWFLIPVVDKFRKPATKGTLILASAFFVLAAASFFVHFKGATDPACIWWNALPLNVIDHTERLWDWSDLQFLR